MPGKARRAPRACHVVLELSMPPRKKNDLSVGCLGFDRVRPLYDGRVEMEDYAFRIPRLSSMSVQHTSLARSQLALVEVTLGFFAAYLDAGHTNYVGLPIPIVRAFRHSAIYVREGGRIRRPEDLQGGRIGLPDMAGTTYIWQKGILQDDYGIDLGRIGWVVGKVDESAVNWKPPTKPILERFDVEVAGPEETLAERLHAGDIDALLTYRRPEAFKSRSGIVRLFPDYLATEKDYYARTKNFPILHIMVLRRQEAERDPDLPRKLVTAFTAAKNIVLEEMREPMYPFATVPFLSFAVEESEMLLGRDFWPYGLDEAARSVDTLLRYCAEQAVTRRRLATADIFPTFQAAPDEAPVERATALQP
jgi:4,5-dihydroxyphthalate decarboxylase